MGERPKMIVRAIFVSLVFLLMGCLPETAVIEEKRPPYIHGGKPTPPTPQSVAATGTKLPTAVSIATPIPSSTPTPLAPQFPGHLLFSSRQTDTNGDGIIQPPDGIHIYRMDLGSGKTVRLTSSSHFDTDPAWSPDGSQIAFVSTRGGNVDLFMMDENGDNIQQLTQTGERVRHPDWSPDGQQIVFSGGSFDAPSLFLLELESGNVEALMQTAVSDSHPAWSDNGRYIVFERTNPAGIYLVDLNLGTEHLLILGDFHQPQWVPDSLGVGERPTLLSVRQSDASGRSTIRLFNFVETDALPELEPTGVQVTAVDEAIWTTNGEWLIGAINQENRSILRILPVALEEERRYTFEAESEQLTRNNFFQGNLDWTP